MTYDLNVTAWEQDHPGWQLQPGLEGFGWRARPRRGPGAWVSAATLDELAGLVGERENEGHETQA